MKEGSGMEKDTLCRVFIVDDEYIIRQGIEYLLDWEKEGFTLVGEASNGEEALQKIEELHPHIVLSDIVMPKLDGIDLTKIIQEKYPDIRVIILSSYSDFDYVKDTFQHGAVDYILKPTLNPKDLLAALKKVVAKMPGMNLQSMENMNVGRAISRYILGFDQQLDEEALKKVFPASQFILLATNKKFYHTLHIEEFFQKQLYTELKAYHPCAFQLQDDILCCLFNADHINEMMPLLEKLLQETGKEKALFACSHVFSSVSDIHKIYHSEIWNLLQLRFYAKQKLMLTMQDLKQTQSFDKFDARSFNNHLDAMNVYLAMDELKDYVDSAIAHQIAEGELKSQIGSALYNLISVFEDHQMNPESIRHFKLNCINLLESAIYKEDFLEQLHQIYQDFEVIVEQFELDNSQEPMNQILRYIQEHYDEDLTLNDLAERFGFSYHYLSAYFAQRSDGTFIEYLNQIRIQHACELLNRKEYTISQVGAMSGYTNHSYFCKVFKKMTGKTPSEYRKR